MDTRLLLGPGIACAALVAILARPVTVADESLGLDVNHARVQVLHNDDGTVTRGIRNEAETSNWSGYVLTNYVTGQSYTSATASWEVPKVAYQPPAEVCHAYRAGSTTREICTEARPAAEYSSSWVGIGGTCENATCSKTDNTLIQIGTEQDVSSTDHAQYYAWYEMLPAYPVLIAPNAPNCNDLTCAYPVRPGDAISASLVCDQNCTPGAEQTWLLTLTDQTQNWTFSKTVVYQSTLASAEWIQEAPSSSAGVLPLADFVTASFDPTVNAGAAPSFPSGTSGTPGVDAVLMVDPYGEVSVPSAAAKLSVFATCWGNSASKLPTCSAP